MEKDTEAIVRSYEEASSQQPASASEERYRDRWRWDKGTWGTHCVDCYPGYCPMRVYVRDGKVVRE